MRTIHGVRWRFEPLLVRNQDPRLAQTGMSAAKLTPASPAESASTADVIAERRRHLARAFEEMQGHVIDAEIDLSYADKYIERGDIRRAAALLSNVADSLRSAQRVSLGEGENR